MKKGIIWFVLCFALVSCGGNEDSMSSRMKAKMTEESHPGKELFKKHCSLCHSLDAPEGSRIAPLAGEMVGKYKAVHAEKNAFTAAMLGFIQQPTEEKTLMPDAIQKYGLMPKQQFPSDALNEIVDYLFNADFSEQAPTSSTKSPAEIGLEYALETKKVLGKNLMGAIQNEGVLHALQFCNVQAMPLTDSMSMVHNATVRRVSNKPRNPMNRANSEEEKHIQYFQQLINEGKDPEPIVKEIATGYQFYYPIVTNDMCLKCHGTPEKEVALKIAELYPNDEAVGYGENQVRGIWSIVFGDQ
jgi:cytochrome c2